MKKELLFFFCIIRIRENFKLMRMLKKLISYRQNIPFCVFDALLIYYYLILGLQSDTCLNYVEFYITKVYTPHTLITNFPHNSTTVTH
jgi:hypothetical protein